MIQIDKKLINELFDKAVVSDRKRMNYDLRTSSNDGSQRMLNALLPGSIVPIHRHPHSNENVLLLQGKLIEVLFEEETFGEDMPMGMDAQDVVNGVRLREKERITLDPSVGNYGCVVPAGAWHTVEVLEPSVIYEAKDGKYGEDGSETFDEYKAKVAQDLFLSSFSNNLGDLKKNIKYLIGMERQSGSMDMISPLYVSRMLNVPLEDVEKCMKDMEE